MCFDGGSFELIKETDEKMLNGKPHFLCSGSNKSIVNFAMLSNINLKQFLNN